MIRHIFRHVVVATIAGLTAIPALAVAQGDETQDATAPSARVEEKDATKAAPAKDAAALSRPNHRFFNVRLAAGADFALGNDLSSRGFGEVGGQGAIGIDWVIVEPLAFSILVGYSAFSSGDLGALQDLFATVGFRLRLFADTAGALGQPGGNVKGHLFLDAHFGYHSYENQEHAGYNIGAGYEFSLAKDFNLGPYCRFAHTPIGDGFSYFSFAFGIQASVGGKFSPDDVDLDTVEDGDDACPLDPEDKDNFEDEDGCPDTDNDNDGVPDADDECPDLAGVASNKGCAETDNDHDKISNDIDECPDEAEDMDGFEDDDGCPDPDNDRDGVADGADRCPFRAEDVDGFEDEDGCPDPDNDKDGIGDGDDSCPFIPENKNTIDDSDGCPDFIRLEERRIVLLEGVYFDKADANVQERSWPMLEEVAGLMALNPDLRVRIEGHSHNRGGKQKNIKRTTKRAEAVKAFLVSRGIADSRITAEGIGQDRPLTENTTKEGRERNERIEIIIVPAAAPPTATAETAPAETTDTP